MAHSFLFNDIDLGQYGLRLVSLVFPFTQKADSVQLQDRAYAFHSYRVPKAFSLAVLIIGDNPNDLFSKIDSIQKVLNEHGSKELIFDHATDRYWLARFVSFQGVLRGIRAWQARVEFICHDPAAYSVTETSNDYNINADPKTITETTGGTDFISPIYTLTAGENRAMGNIKVKSVSTNEELIWNGAISNGQKLMIDVAKWYISLEGASAMSGVSGQFPRLTPNAANNIVITEFGSLGSLNITYRNRFV